MKHPRHPIASGALSRRELLQAAGAAASLAMLGAAPAFAQRSGPWDLIVIGGGTAGLPAAIFAARRGARVLVVEKASQLGGTLHLSTGQMAAAGTGFQAQAGIEDSAEAHFEDAMRINGGTGDARIIRLWTREAAPTIDWLTAHGFELAPGLPVRGQAHEPYLTERYFWGPDGGLTILALLLAQLEPQVAAGRVQVLLDTGAVELIQETGGRVTGVVVEGTDGRRQDLHGSRVLLASGGCAANPRLFEDLHGVPLYCQAAYPYSQGAGLMLGLGAGGQLHGGDKYLGLFGGVMADAWTPAALDLSLALDVERRAPWELYVNVHGRRFIREDEPSIHARELSLREQTGNRFWVIFDEQALTGAPPIVPRWEEARLREAFSTHALFFSAPTLATLATRAGIHPLELQRSVADYNARRAARQPDALGREIRPAAIDRGPFYAIQCQSWTLVSFAGLVVDERLRVLRADGSPVPNLYAAGEVLGAGATSGKAYVGGSLVTPALTFGRLLGQGLEFPA